MTNEQMQALLSSDEQFDPDYDEVTSVTQVGPNDYMAQVVSDLDDDGTADRVELVHVRAVNDTLISRERVYLYMGD